MNNIHFSSKTVEWQTPQYLVDRLARFYSVPDEKFDLDPACKTDDISKAKHCYTPEQDGLKQSWFGNVFLNPPYARGQLSDWISKALKESISPEVYKIICLIPARTDTKYWHELVFPKATTIVFLQGRVKFLGAGGEANSAPFPSAVVSFDKSSNITWRADPRIETLKGTR